MKMFFSKLSQTKKDITKEYYNNKKSNSGVCKENNTIYLNEHIIRKIVEMNEHGDKGSKLILDLMIIVIVCI